MMSMKQQRLLLVLRLKFVTLQIYLVSGDRQNLNDTLHPRNCRSSFWRSSIPKLLSDLYREDLSPLLADFDMITP